MKEYWGVLDINVPFFQNKKFKRYTDEEISK